MDKRIHIFFSCDNNYIPFLAVAIKSLEENASKNRLYQIVILHAKAISTENIKKIKSEFESDIFAIDFKDISAEIEKFSCKLYTRDYYTKTTYYRLLIPSLYPNIDKAIYLDSDIAVAGNIAEFFDTDIGDCYVGAIPDGSVQCIKCFQDYVQKRIGVKTYSEYFNAGILILNLAMLRKIDFENKFAKLLSLVKFEVAQDQDYLNVICNGHSKLLGFEWDAMPIMADKIAEKDIKIAHYNLTFKPWQIDNVPFENLFWKYAKMTSFYDQILSQKKSSVTKKDESTDNLIELTKKQAQDTKENQKIQKLVQSVLKGE